MEKFGANFVTKDGTSDGAHLRDVKLVGLYFGAKYCRPAQEFNDILVNFYNEINKEDKVFEIIYFGFDQKQADFNQNLKQMPWVAYDFKDMNKIKFYLEFQSEIKGIPSVLILNPSNAKLLTNKGRSNIQTTIYPSEAFEKWIEIKDMK